MRSEDAKRLARFIIKGAGQQGLTFRAFGGAGVMLLAPSSLPDDVLFRRETSDVDLIGRYQEQFQWEDLFKALKFRLHTSDMGAAQAQYEFRGTFEGRECLVHVYTDPMRFSEVIPGPYFTSLWPMTIPPTALLLSKLLVRRGRGSHEQAQDVAALLFSEGGALQSDRLDIEYLAKSLMRGFAGWRRWVTVQSTLDELDAMLLSMAESDIAMQVRSGLIQLRGGLMNARPDWRWRIARAWHRTRLPGPVYRVDRVEPLSERYGRRAE